MAVLGLASRLPHAFMDRHCPSGISRGWDGAEEWRQMSFLSEWTLKWRQAFRPHWVPLENDAIETSSLVGSCSVDVWCGGCSCHALSTAVPLAQVHFPPYLCLWLVFPDYTVSFQLGLCMLLPETSSWNTASTMFLPRWKTYGGSHKQVTSVL